MFRAESLPETCRIVIPIKVKFSASVGLIHTEHRLDFWEYISSQSHHCTGEGTDRFFVRPLYARPDFNPFPQHPDLLVVSVIFSLFLILWCFEDLCLLSFLVPNVEFNILSDG